MVILDRGGSGIRTHGTLSGPATFKVAAFDRSATPPTAVYSHGRGGLGFHLDNGPFEAAAWYRESPEEDGRADQTRIVTCLARPRAMSMAACSSSERLWVDWPPLTSLA